jgi:hypothetical protein
MVNKTEANIDFFIVKYLQSTTNSDCYKNTIYKCK